MQRKTLHHNQPLAAALVDLSLLRAGEQARLIGGRIHVQDADGLVAAGDTIREAQDRLDDLTGAYVAARQAQVRR